MNNALVSISGFKHKKSKAQPKKINDALHKLYTSPRLPNKIRGYSFVKELMQPETQYIKEQKEVITQINEVKKSLCLLEHQLEMSKINRKFLTMANFLTNASKRRWF